MVMNRIAAKMKYDKREFKIRERRENLKLLKEESEIRKLENEYRCDPIQASKLIMAFILLNCSIVELYSMIVMVVFRNLEPLSTLITTVIAESLSYAVYCAKSYHETKAESDNSLEKYRIDSTYNTEQGCAPIYDDHYCPTKDEIELYLKDSDGDKI